MAAFTFTSQVSIFGGNIFPLIFFLNSSDASNSQLDLSPSFIFTLKHDGTVKAETSEFEINTFCYYSQETDSSLSTYHNLCKIQIMADSVSLAGFQGSLQLQSYGTSKWRLSYASEEDHFTMDVAPYLWRLFGEANSKNLMVSYNLHLLCNQNSLQTTLKAPLLAGLACLMVSVFTQKLKRYMLVFMAIIVTSITMLEISKLTETFSILRLSE